MKSLVFLVLFGLAAAGRDVQWFKQTLDHFHLPAIEAGTFQQRYWTLAGNPSESHDTTFLFLCEQSDCLISPPSFAFPLGVAQEHGALVFLLEHRYYGKSLPYGEAAMLPQLFTHLEVSQVLGDVAEFVIQWNQRIPTITKWVIVGGGYAGALAAWSRTRYPDLIAAAWASSAPVNLILDFFQYDEQVYASALLSPNCAETIQELTKYVDALYESGTVIPTLTDLLEATASFNNTPDGRPALWYLADIIGKLIEFGHRTEMCENLSAAETPSSAVSSLLQLAKAYHISDPAVYGVNPLNVAIWKTTSYARQQYWQMCTQLAWFQTASEKRMRSKFLTVGFWAWYCNVVFGYPGGLALPDVQQTNDEVSWKGTRIIFTNGSEDPWRWASVQQTSEKAQRISILADCTDCAHCIDFQPERKDESVALKEMRSQIRKYLNTWLQD